MIDKYVIGFIWFLSLMGALLIGHEIAMMKHDLQRSVMNERLQACNKIIAGSLYE